MADCVGCGYCCLKVPCYVAKRMYGEGITECPDLKWNGERYVCRLCELPNPKGADYRHELHVGVGCCCSLNTWRKDVQPRHNENKSEIHIDSIFQTFLFSLGKQFISSDCIFLALSKFKSELVEKGYSKEDTESFAALIKHYLYGQRSKFMEDFIG